MNPYASPSPCESRQPHRCQEGFIVRHVWRCWIAFCALLSPAPCFSSPYTFFVPGTDWLIPQLPVLPESGLYQLAEYPVRSLAKSFGYSPSFVYFHDHGPPAIQPFFVVAFWATTLLISISMRYGSRAFRRRKG